MVSAALSERKVAGSIPTIGDFHNVGPRKKQSSPVWPPTLNKIPLPLPFTFITPKLTIFTSTPKTSLAETRRKTNVKLATVRGRLARRSPLWLRWLQQVIPAKRVPWKLRRAYRFLGSTSQATCDFVAILRVSGSCTLDQSLRAANHMLAEGVCIASYVNATWRCCSFHSGDTEGRSGTFLRHGLLFLLEKPGHSRTESSTSKMFASLLTMKEHD